MSENTKERRLNQRRVRQKILGTRPMTKRTGTDRRSPVVQEADPVVGHKTLRADDGTLYHEPLRRAEADAIMAMADAQEAKRKLLYPDEQAAVHGICDAHQRMKELGWREACYAPFNRPLFLVEAGSSGIHQGYRDEERRFWVEEPGDYWPASPILFKEQQ